jgi:hypothetical protein
MYVVRFDEKFIGPFLFEEPMVIGDISVAMMEKPVLTHEPVATVFQLDGAQLHFFHRVRAISWSPRSALTLLDFFFWRFVKDFVYREKFQNMSELR